jgi:hypothetical protein
VTTTGSTLAHTPTISDPTASPDATPAEQVARRWFAFAQNGNFGQLAELLHDDVLIVSKVQAGAVLDGRAEATRFIEETLAGRLYEAAGDVYTPLDETRVVIEGRMRWIDDDRVIRDDPVVWAMECRDGLVFRFAPARTTMEAEAILASPR